MKAYTIPVVEKGFVPVDNRNVVRWHLENEDGTLIRWQDKSLVSAPTQQQVLELARALGYEVYL